MKGHQNVRPKGSERSKASTVWPNRTPKHLVETRRLRLVLLRGSLLGGLLGLGLGGSLTLGTLVLHILIIDVEGLVNLSAESLLIIKPGGKNISKGSRD